MEEYGPLQKVFRLQDVQDPLSYVGYVRCTSEDEPEDLRDTVLPNANGVIQKRTYRAPKKAYHSWRYLFPLDLRSGGKNLIDRRRASSVK